MNLWDLRSMQRIEAIQLRNRRAAIRSRPQSTISPRRWQASKPDVRAQRQSVPDDDPFLLAERSTSEQTSAALEAWRKVQSEAQDRIFHALYR